MSTVSILGCGWLGFTLAKKLCHAGFRVKGSTTTQSKLSLFEKEGIKPYLIEATKTDDASLKAFLEADVLVLALPPKKRGVEAFMYSTFIHKISQLVNKNTQVILISSTSIYPNLEQTFTEAFKLTKSNNGHEDLFLAEQAILHTKNVILRCSGLMGYERVAGKYFAGKNLDTGDIKVNYVHRDDVITAIITCITKQANGIFNLCAPLHPTRKEVYEHFSKLKGFEPIQFLKPLTPPQKIIDGTKIVCTLGFEYKFQDPLKFI